GLYERERDDDAHREYGGDDDRTEDDLGWLTHEWTFPAGMLSASVVRRCPFNRNQLDGRIKTTLFVVATEPRFGHFDHVLAVFLQGDDVFFPVVEFHQVEFVLAGFEYLDALELVVEFAPKRRHVRVVLFLRR